MTEAARLSRYAFLVFEGLLGVLYVALPALTRPGLFFAVTVEPAFRKTAAGRGVVRGYRTVVAAATIVAMAATWRLDPSLHLQAAVWPLAGLLGVAMAAFLWARSKVLPHAAATPAVREASLRPRAVTLPGGTAAQAGPFVILLAAAGWLAANWQRIPPRFPVHWNAAGVPDAVASRTPAAVFEPLVSSALICLLLLVCAVGLLLWTRRVAASGTAADREGRFQRLVLLVLLGAEYLVAATAALAASLPVLGPAAAHWMLPLVLGLTVVFVVLLVAAFFRSGQGGSRFAAGESGDEAMATDGTEDRFWKAGIFYVNPNDPAIFVEKRFGIGYTLNFGNPRAWLILAVILVPIAIVVAVSLAGH